MHQRKFSEVWAVIAVVGGFGFALISAPASAGSAESSSSELPQVAHRVAHDNAQANANLEARVRRLERRLKRNERGQIGQVFLRGGAAFIENQRAGQDQTTGYYTGAGIDLILSENAWGLLPGTEVRGELGFEFKEFDESSPFGVSSETTMLTVSMAPKLMFLKGASIRPWIIPVGLDIHVISPPSSNVSELDVGGQAGVGLQYNVWKAFNIGIDGRYHLAADTGTATNNNFGTVGGYIGASF